MGKRQGGVVLSVVLCAAVSRAQGIKSQIDALTGGLRTRIVWIQSASDATSPQLYGGGALMGYDSQDDVARQILPAVTRQNKPIICSGGYRVVITRNYQVYVVNWDGTGLRLVTSGIASDVWMDPATGLEWVVVRKGTNTNTGQVIRYLLDDPNQSVLLWNKTGVGDYYMNWYQISADGKVAVDFLPWDRAFSVDSGAYVLNGYHVNPPPARGCWATLACDNSYCWVHLPLTGIGHSGLNVYRRADTVRTQVPITAPKSGGTYYHPKFASGSIANGGRFIVLTNNDGAGTPAEVCLGKFDSTYTGFDGWVQVTNNSVTDFTPDAWVGVAQPSPSMRLSRDTLAFTAPQGGANPASQPETVSTAYGTLNGVTASENAPWLAVSVSGSGATWVITNTVSTAGLASGVYRATVTVSASNAVPTIRTYTVKLTVTGTPVAATVRITPSEALVAKQRTVQLTATVYDQMEQPMNPQPSVTWSVLAPANGVTVNAGTVTAGTIAGIVRVVAQSGSFTDTANVTVVDFIPVHIKVNCGDNSPGYVPGWEGDLQFVVPGYEGSWWPDDVGGRAVDVSAVPNPPPRDVYVRFRGGAVRYSFPSDRVPPGPYRVRLHFWEPYANESRNPRAINCTIEGTTVMTGMRILTEAGGVLFKAVVKEYDVSVNNDGMQMQLGGSEPMILGMEVISSGSLAKQITLLEPLGGGKYRVGEALTVRWSALASINAVVVELSPDAGDHWCMVVPNGITPSDPQWGSYRWTITPTVQESNGSAVFQTASSEVLVRVRHYTSEVKDVSPAPMTIEAAVAAVGRPAVVSRHVPVVRRMPGGLVVSVPWTGPHVVEVFSLSGQRIACIGGAGPGSHWVQGSPWVCGSAIVRVRGDDGRVVQMQVIRTQ